MMRLVRRGLLYGDLYEVRSKAMAERYNRALEHLSGRRTGLTDFHVDMSGFSPEIADELDDEDYLNPNGVNRQFIILSTEQSDAPLIHARFSSSKPILESFIRRNEQQLTALTAGNAVVGELVNSLIALERLDQLLTIRKIEIEADTVNSRIDAAEKLAEKIATFTNEPDAWWDDVLIAEMIELGKVTGDITRFPVRLGKSRYAHENFYSTHFGGVYIFHDLAESACILADPDQQPGILPVDWVFKFEDRVGIAAYLWGHDLVEPIAPRAGSESAAILKQKLDFILADAAAEAGEDLSGLSKSRLRALTRKLYADLPPAYRGLEELWKWAMGQGPEPRIEPEHPAYFYKLRARNHKDKRMVNMLLAELSPLDFRQLFICHKEAFYTAYRQWSDAKREFASRFLEQGYVVDKSRVRSELFGDDKTSTDEYKVISDEAADGPFMGPWGLRPGK